MEDKTPAGLARLRLVTELWVSSNFPFHPCLLQHDKSHGAERLLHPQGHLRVHQPVASEPRRVSIPKPPAHLGCPGFSWHSDHADPCAKKRLDHVGKGRLDQKRCGFEAEPSLGSPGHGADPAWLSPRFSSSPTSGLTQFVWKLRLLDSQESVDPAAKQVL